jgi:hypothetical protein
MYADEIRKKFERSERESTPFFALMREHEQQL